MNQRTHQILRNVEAQGQALRLEQELADKYERDVKRNKSVIKTAIITVALFAVAYGVAEWLPGAIESWWHQQYILPNLK